MFAYRPGFLVGQRNSDQAKAFGGPGSFFAGLSKAELIPDSMFSWPWFKTVLGSRFGLGEFTTQFTYFSGWIESDVHQGYSVLTHSHLGIWGGKPGCGKRHVRAFSWPLFRV